MLKDFIFHGRMFLNEIYYQIRYEYSDKIKTQEYKRYTSTSGKTANGGLWKVEFDDSFYIYSRYLYVSVIPVKNYIDPVTNETKNRKARDWHCYYDKRPNDN